MNAVMEMSSSTLGSRDGHILQGRATSKFQTAFSLCSLIIHNILPIKFPVRRKAISNVDVTESIRRALEPFALIYPEITLTLVDKLKNVTILSKRKVSEL